MQNFMAIYAGLHGRDRARADLLGGLADGADWPADLSGSDEEDDQFQMRMPSFGASGRE